MTSILETEDLEAMIAACRTLSGLQDSAVISARAARMAQTMADVDLVGIAAREDERQFSMLGVAGDIGDTYGKLRFDVDVGLGLTGTILATGLCLCFRPSAPDAGIGCFDPATGAQGELVLGATYARHLRKRIGEEALEEYLGAPIAAADRVYGVLYAGMRSPRGFTSRQRVLVARFAQMIAPMLDAAFRARNAALAELTREREAIAFRLHDTIGQILFGIGTSARRGRSLLPHDPQTAALHLATIEDEASRAAAHLREILRHLGEGPAGSTLAAEMQVLASMFSARTSIAADVIITGTMRDLPADTAAVILAVVREGLHNAEKHADADAVVVLLNYGPDQLTVSVQDDGVGVADSYAIPSAGTGGTRLGLPALARRIARLGGTIVLEPGDDGGATLKAVV